MKLPKYTIEPDNGNFNVYKIKRERKNLCGVKFSKVLIGSSKTLEEAEEVLEEWIKNNEIKLYY